MSGWRVGGERADTATPSGGLREAACATQENERTPYTPESPAARCGACEAQCRGIHSLTAYRIFRAKQRFDFGAG